MTSPYVQSGSFLLDPRFLQQDGWLVHIDDSLSRSCIGRSIHPLPAVVHETDHTIRRRHGNVAGVRRVVARTIPSSCVGGVLDLQPGHSILSFPSAAFVPCAAGSCQIVADARTCAIVLRAPLATPRRRPKRTSERSPPPTHKRGEPLAVLLHMPDDRDLFVLGNVQ
jgi:hypothetical protein